MRKILVVVLGVLLVSLSAEAATSARALPLFGMVSLADRVLGRISDDDPQRLFRDMQVKEEVKNNIRGKVIRFADKAMVLNCAIRPGDVGNCSMILKSGKWSKIAANHIRFLVQGPEAMELFAQFPAQEGVYRFQTTDGYFHIEARPESFLAEYFKP